MRQASEVGGTEANRKSNRLTLFKWASGIAAGLGAMILVSAFLINEGILPTPPVTELENVHPFLITEAEANHLATMVVEAPQIYVCDHCHGVVVTLTSGTLRRIATDGGDSLPGAIGGWGVATNGAADQTVSQGQEWGATVAGMFTGKHAAGSSRDEFGQDMQIYASYLDDC